MPRMKLLPRIMHICGTLDCDGYISPCLIGLGMEEANTNPIQPDDEEMIFTAETQHCDTGEVGFHMMILPKEVDPMTFGDWLQGFVNETHQIPKRFEVRKGEVVLMSGGVQE